MAELANCLNCDAVFVKNIRSICQDCYQAEEKAFEIVYRFLTKRKNREATLEEIVDATEVSEKLITKFIKDNRLRKSEFPNIGYPCDTCGANITSGRLCTACSNSFIDEYDYHEEAEKRLEKRRAEENKAQVYYSFIKD